MTPTKIISVIETYEFLLQAKGVPKKRCDESRKFSELTKDELLAHAHFLCDGVKEYANDPAKLRKTGSHLTAVQMCLSFAGWFTLGDLMEHNRPRPEPIAKQQFIPGITNFMEPSGAT